mmetsp:Transcript_38615/g.95514  ORF Transcript_38615/g.95514 Transcript_38615/m.95514 type:complete len:215 (-) Transcript_38615:631-1275(-)
MLFVTMLLLPSCAIKTTKTTTTMRLPASRAGVAARGSRLHAETTIKTSKTTTTTAAAGHVAGASGARAASSEPSLTINKQHARATFRITLLPRPGVYAGKSRATGVFPVGHHLRLLQPMVKKTKTRGVSMAAFSRLTMARSGPGVRIRDQIRKLGALKLRGAGGSSRGAGSSSPYFSVIVGGRVGEWVHPSKTLLGFYWGESSFQNALKLCAAS